MTNTNIVPSQCPIPSEVASEYRELFRLERLNQEQQTRMEEILKKAAEDEELDFWISKVESEEGSNSELLDKKNRKSYRNQRALMSEHVNMQDPFDSPLKEPDFGLPGKELTADSPQDKLIDACESGGSARDFTAWRNSKYPVNL